MLSDFDSQWGRILSDGPFSERCLITPKGSVPVEVRGILSYGAESVDSSSVGYQSKRDELYWQFKMAASPIGADVLKGAWLKARGRSYRVLQVTDVNGCELVLRLSPLKEGEDATSNDG